MENLDQPMRNDKPDNTKFTAFLEAFKEHNETKTRVKLRGETWTTPRDPTGKKTLLEGQWPTIMGFVAVSGPRRSYPEGDVFEAGVSAVGELEGSTADWASGAYSLGHLGTIQDIFIEADISVQTVKRVFSVLEFNEKVKAAELGENEERLSKEVIKPAFQKVRRTELGSLLEGDDLIFAVQEEILRNSLRAMWTKMPGVAQAKPRCHGILIDKDGEARFITTVNYDRDDIAECLSTKKSIARNPEATGFYNLIQDSAKEAAERKTDKKLPLIVNVFCSDSRVDESVLVLDGYESARYAINAGNRVHGEINPGDVILEQALAEGREVIVQINAHGKCGAVSAAVDAVMQEDMDAGHGKKEEHHGANAHGHEYICCHIDPIKEVAGIEKAKLMETRGNNWTADELKAIVGRAMAKKTHDAFLEKPLVKKLDQKGLLIGSVVSEYNFHDGSGAKIIFDPKSGSKYSLVKAPATGREFKPD